MGDVMADDELRAKMQRARKSCTDTMTDHPHGNCSWEENMVEVIDGMLAELDRRQKLEAYDHEAALAAYDRWAHQKPHRKGMSYVFAAGWKAALPEPPTTGAK